MMHVGHVVAGIGDEKAGTSPAVLGICRGLHDMGVELSLHSLDARPCSVPFPHYVYPPHRLPFHLLGRSPEMLHALKAQSRGWEILHDHALWMMPNIYASWSIHGKPCKLVTSPHGSLSAQSLKRSRLKKALFWWTCQRAALARTDMWHATCEKEFNEIRALGYRQPVAIVPLGMDAPALTDADRATFTATFGTPERKRVVFFGRIHPIKGVDRLVAAWGRLAPRFPEWELVLAGPDCGGRAACEELVAQNAIPRVSFPGEMLGKDKYAFLESSALYVLPSFTENFAITVAEALVCGTPVIASTGSPWQGLIRERAGWWVENSVDALEATLADALSRSEAELHAMGERGRAWILRDFTWSSAGAKMKAAYAWLLNQAPQPPHVITD